MLIHSNEKDFADAIKGKVVLVDFYATWCGPCRMLSQQLEDVSDQIEIIKIDVDENMNLAKEYGVMVVPTLVVLKDGQLKTKLTGYMSKEEILEVMAQYSN